MITDALEINDANHLDLTNLHIGCKIEVDLWLSCCAHPYITFIKGINSKTTPDYFLKAIGCDEYSDSRTQTQALIRALDEYANYKGYGNEKKAEINQQIYSHCKDRGKVDIKLLSELIDHEHPDDFIEFVNDKDYKISYGFEPNTRILNNLREIYTNGDGIKLSFPAKMLGNRIIYSNYEGNSQIIIKKSTRINDKSF